MKLDVVREAFHVGDVDYYETDNAQGMAYTPTEPDLTTFYRDVAVNYPNVSVLVYNGDTDPAITSFAAQNWTSHLGLTALQEWRPWTVDTCRGMGGYVTRYQGGLDFVTIRGSGHMVPAMKPVAAFVMLQSWLHGQDYPPYVGNCTAPPPSTTTTSTSTTATATNPESSAAAAGRDNEKQQEAKIEPKQYVRVAK